MNVFDPFSTHPPSRFTAVVRIPPASEPDPGSVSPHAPSHSPLASFGIQRFFCASLPPIMMWVVHSELWLPNENPPPPPPRATSPPATPPTRDSSSPASTYST